MVKKQRDVLAIGYSALERGYALASKNYSFPWSWRLTDDLIKGVAIINVIYCYQ